MLKAKKYIIIVTFTTKAEVKYIIATENVKSIALYGSYLIFKVIFLKRLGEVTTL